MAGYDTEAGLRQVAMLTPEEQARDGNADEDRRGILAEIQRTTDPRARAALNFEYNRRFNGGPSAPAAVSMRDGFPELRAGVGDLASAAASPGAAPSTPMADAARRLIGGAPASGGSMMERARALLAQPDPEPPPPPSGILRRVIGDSAVSLGRGVIGVPEALTGMADLVSGGRAGKALQDVGVDFKRAKDILAEQYSPEQKAANEEVSKAEGFLPKVAAMARNPSTAVQQAIESAPSALAGGAVSRGVLAVAPRVGAIAAGALGEGATAAGQNAEQVRQEDPNGTLTGKQSAILGASGLLTGGIGLGSGQIANKLGVSTIETMLAQGRLGAVGKVAMEKGATKGMLVKAVEGGLTEGVLQELPQSYQEQVAQNIAQGKPWDEGAAAAGAQGMLAGGLMGAVGGPLEGRHEASPPALVVGVPPAVVAAATGQPVAPLKTAGDIIRQDLQPGAGPLTTAVNAGIETAAQAADAATPSAELDAPHPPRLLSADHLAAIRNLPPEQQEDAVKYGEMGNDPTVTPNVRRFAQAKLDAMIGDQAPLNPIVDDPKTGEPVLPETPTVAAPKVGNETDQVLARAESDLRRTDAEAAAQREADRPPIPTGEPQDGDILNRAGKPFTTMPGAQRALAAAGDGHGLVRVADGLVVRKTPTVDPQTGEIAAKGGTDESGSTAVVQRDQGGATAVPPALGGTGTLDAAQPESTSVAQPVADAGESAAAPDRAVRGADGQPAVAQPAHIGGEHLAEGFHAFTPESGTLGVPRADMPQVKAVDRGALVNFLGARGITHESVEMPSEALKPTQAEFSPEKVIKAMGFTDTDRSILVSSDNHVLDGHHQWMAKREAGLPIKAIRLNAPIADLLPLVREFPSSTAADGATQASNAKDEQNPPAGARTEAEAAPAQAAAAEPAPVAIADAQPAGLPATGRAAVQADGLTPQARWTAATKDERHQMLTAAGWKGGPNHTALTETAWDDIEPLQQKRIAAQMPKESSPATLVAAPAPAPATPTPEATAPAPKFPNARTKAVAKKAANGIAADEKARADYFVPGNIVRGYGGFDEVLAYNAPTSPGGAWSVRVHEVKKVNDQWVRVGKPQDARMHSTQPDARELAKGPVAQVASQTAADVPHTEPRADGKGFPNAEKRAAPAASESPATPLAAKKPLYASRPVVNADAIIAWAKSQGFTSTLPAADMHVTVAYSSAPMDGAAAGDAGKVAAITGGKRTVELLGDKGAVVLKFESPEMQARWKAYRDAGASWDYEGYQPHVTLTYSGGDLDLSKIKPYDGPIELGTERREALNEDKVDKYKETPTVAKSEPDAVERAVQPETPPVDPTRSAKPDAVAPSKIEDFGAELKGAKKMLYAARYADSMDEALKLDVKTNPLSATWPAPDYAQLIKDGADPFVVGFIRAARDMLPNKPASAWKIKGWTENVQTLRDLQVQLLTGEKRDALLSAVAARPELAGARAMAQVYEAVGHDVSLKGVRVETGTYLFLDGKAKNPPVTRVSINQKAKGSSFGNWGRDLATGATLPEAIEAFKAKLAEKGEETVASRIVKFGIYSDRKGDIFIGKKVGKEIARLKAGFKDANSARVYLAEHQADLEKSLADYKDVPNERKETNDPRVGADHRAGADVTAQQFTDAFGFRGVQFGNYVEGPRRQQDLNNAYDALMDLAGIVGVPARALSLNGQMGLAFGARGSGKAMAHYEPGNVVINLTKTSGAGSLAHEWWHALDNYFGKAGGVREAGGGYLTEGAARASDEVRAEMKREFDAIGATLRASQMAERSRLLDSRREKPYWGTGRELSARAFESYVIAKLNDQSASNDYLANIVPEEQWKKQGTYPYPVGADVPKVRAAFDSFFNTLEARDPDDAGNVAMFSRRNDTPIGLPPVVIGHPLASLNTLPGYAEAKAGDERAALSVAEALVTDKLAADIRQLIGERKPIVVPVVAVEAAGRNKIPKAAAEVIGHRLGLRTDDQIVQVNSPQRTSMDGLGRLLSPPEFDGEAQKGESYLLVDDALTQGGTFAALESHIRQSGGEVVGAISLTGKQYSATMRASPELLGQVRERFSAVEPDFRAATGYGFDALTESEARYLAKHGAPAVVRNRIAAAGNEAQRRVDAGGIEQGEVAGESTRTSTVAQEDQAFAERIAAGWENKPDIKVVTSIDDPQVPQAVRDEDDKQRSLGAGGDPEGVFHAGTVYLFSDQLRGEADIRRVLMHETLGHYGLRGFFGKELGTVLDRMAVARPAELKAKAEKYGLDLAKPKERRAAAEEMLAELAQTHPELGWVRQAIAAVRTWIRKHIPGAYAMKMSDDELIKQFILSARDWVTKSGQTTISRTAFAETQPAVREIEPGMPMFSRSLGAQLGQALNSTRDINLPAGYKVNDLLDRTGKLSVWHKTVGTQYNLAQRSPEFGRVFDGVQNFINDTSYYANEAANLAPKILPKLENWKDITKSPISATDTKALAGPVFDGTLNYARDASGRIVHVDDLQAAADGMTSEEKARALFRNGHLSEQVLKMWQGLPVDKFDQIIGAKYERDMLKAGVVWTDDELRGQFSMTPAQIGLYREFRAATDKSLSSLAVSEMLNHAGNDVDAVRQQALDLGDHDRAAVLLRDHLFALGEADPSRQAALDETANKMIEIADRATDLQKRGYAPLSRFGTYTLDATLPTGEHYFSLFETTRERAKMARQLAASGATGVKSGTMSQLDYKLLQGVSPETVALFGDMLGLESQGNEAKDLAFQTYIKKAVANRSALKRLLARKGIAGFSQDAGRVLAGFVYSNGRRTSSNLHSAEISDATAAIQKESGELKDAAVKLSEYVKNPQEEAQGLRGLLFAQYLGGSVASAMVNATQPFTVTFPYLSQFGGVTAAAKQMAAAVKVAGKKTTGDAVIDAALKKAEDDGIVSPQEIHQLQAQAAGRAALKSGDGTKVGNALATGQNHFARFQLAWGKVFSVAEQFNRRVTFIAAYRTALEQSIPDPAAFAEKAVIETQFLFNKGNKPQWARGAIGGVAFTFKQYSVSYLEMLHRMWTAGEEGSPERAAGRKAVLLAIAVLFLIGGADGLPFEGDAEDVLDGFMQRLGYNFSSRRAKNEFLADVLGDDMARFVNKGLSGLPGAPIDVSGRMGLGNLIPGTGLLTKKADHSSDVAELFGPVGDLGKRAFQAAGQVVDGNPAEALATMSPVATRNVRKAAGMLQTGSYRDQAGRKVIDTTPTEAVMKAIGFQPNSVARVQEATGDVQQQVAMTRLRQTELSGDMAQAVYEKDQAKIEEVRAAMRRWNADNPESAIRLNMASVLQRVRAMREDKATRIEKSSPRGMRTAVRQQLAETAQ